MGDFGWYSDLTEVVEPLASGLPYTVVSLWFWSFMIFALLILLNMLLAIIMESYARVTEELNAMPDAPTLLQQATRYWARTRTYKNGGFIPLNVVLEILADEKAGTHPEEFVTHESMMKAWPKMKTEQATFLMKWLQKDANGLAAKNEASEVLDSVKRCQSLMQTIAENLHSVSLVVMKCSGRLAVLETQPRFAENGNTNPPALPTEPAAEPLADQNSAKGIA